MNLIIKSKFNMVFIFIISLSFLYSKGDTQFRYGKLILENGITIIGEQLEIKNEKVTLRVNEENVEYKLNEIMYLYIGHKQNFSLQWFGYGGGTLFITLLSIGGDFTYYIESTLIGSVVGGVIIGFIIPQIIKISGTKVIKWRLINLTNY